MGKKPAMRGKKRSKKQQQSVSMDTDDDSDSELPRSTYELQRQENIANNQHRLNEHGPRLDMREEPRSTDGVQKQPKKRCAPKPERASRAPGRRKLAVA